MKKLNVALIGYGRSGWGIHGAFLHSEANDICTVVAVVENDPARAAAAKADFNCDTYADYKQLLNRKDIDFVINASYSDLHYPINLDLLNHGFNVLSEKPLCKSPEQAQEMIDVAKKNHCMFTIFHQYRYNEYFGKLVELLNKRVIGEPKLYRVRQNYFSHRYDWQTLLYRDAGSMRNNAAHYIEQIMTLAGTDEIPDIYSRLEIWTSVGDAEDYMFAVMKYSNGKTFEVEVNPSDAFADGKLYDIYGDHGTMQVYSGKIKYKYFLDSEVPAAVLDHHSLHDAKGNPAYCNNNIVWHEEEITLSADVMNQFGKCTSGFYHDVYNHLVNGAELFIKPEHIKAQIAIFQEIERQNPLAVKFARPDDVL